jgi:vacuolar-type H+-ATPase subunit H
MKEIVDKILKVEETARQKIERVRQESQDSIRQAQQQAELLVKTAISEAKAQVEARRDEANQGFASEKEKELKLAQDQISAKRLQKEPDIPSLSDKIFLRIIRNKG